MLTGPSIRHALLLCSVALSACAGEFSKHTGDGAIPPDAGQPGPREAGAEDASGDGSMDGGEGPSPNDTDAQLERFWTTYGGRASFPVFYVAAVETLVRAEDEVFAGNYESARVRMDALLAEYPLFSEVWWEIYRTGESNPLHPHVGEPGTYAALSMLQEIITVGLTHPSAVPVPIQMTVVMPACSNIVPRKGPTLLNYPLDPEITDDSHRVARQSLRLFQSYLWAITGGRLRLELSFVRPSECFEINEAKGFVVGNYPSPIQQLPADVTERTDMYWLIYPSDNDAGLDIGQGGGMGAFGKKPVFISEDDWLVRKVAGQGGGPRTDVERRAYLPEWIQHEFFHHLFRSWPELGLEKTDHQWFARDTWPADFLGTHEEDYYSEALHKRLYAARPTIAEVLRQTGAMPTAKSGREGPGRRLP